MINLKIGIISDLHIFKKTTNLERAISKLRDVDVLLIVGDIADHADEKQYHIVLNIIKERIYDIPVYCVSGNHDNPSRDDTNYRLFENKINNEYPSIVDGSGAFYKYMNEYVDLIGLNPLYYQKQFFFSNKGLQVNVLQERLAASSCKYHIVLCHPPLIAHNPQRTAGMASYIATEQDTRLQSILDENKNVIFLSGHTHASPTIEYDEAHGNLYIQCGSICPTTIKGTEVATQQGNVTLLEISEAEISVIIEGIHREKNFVKKRIVIN